MGAVRLPMSDAYISRQSVRIKHFKVFMLAQGRKNSHKIRKAFRSLGSSCLIKPCQVRIKLSLTIKGCVRVSVCLSVTPFCVITLLSHWVSELNI